MYSSANEVEAVVRGFETCETDKSAFKHREHLTVAVWYLQTSEPAAAVERMRVALLRFLDHHGVPREKYSEEVTVFWIEWIAERLSELAPDVTVVEKCNYVINQTIRTPASPVAVEGSPAKS